MPMLPLNLEFAGAVAETVAVDSQLVEHGQEKIRHWGMRRRHNVTITLKLA